MRGLVVLLVWSLLSASECTAQGLHPLGLRVSTALPYLDLLGLEVDVPVGSHVSVVGLAQIRGERIQCLGVGQVQELPPFYYPCEVEGQSLGGGLRLTTGQQASMQFFLQVDVGTHWYAVGGYREPYFGGRVGVGRRLGAMGWVDGSVRVYRVSGYSRVDQFLVGEGTAVRSFRPRHVFDLGLAFGLLAN